MVHAARSEYYTGVLLIVTSAVAFSTAGLFTKVVEAGSWEVIFWRGVTAAAFTTAWTIHRRTTRPEFSAMGRPGLAIAVIGALGTAAFISSFKLTSIANVSLIYAIAFGKPFGVAWTEILVLSAFGLLFAIASVTLAEGSKRVPSGQTALLSALETPLAPVFAFILLTEIPSSATWIGGSIVLLAVVFSIRNDSRPPATAETDK